MEFHAPAGPIHSIKDFFVHLGIVTIGILIALGLEQLVEAHHRAKVAEIAVQGFRREITDDMDEVKDVLDAMPGLRGRVHDTIAALTETAAAGSHAQPIKYPDIHFNFVSSASWDTALATQALADLPYDSVKRYAAAYGVLHLFLDQETHAINLWQDMRRFGDDPALLSKDERINLVEELRRYDSYTYAIEVIGKGAMQSCTDALK
jgi:hypothetical protein